MLDALSPEDFEEWLAYRKLEPHPLIRILSVLKVGLAAIAGGVGSTFNADDADPMPDD